MLTKGAKENVAVVVSLVAFLFSIWTFYDTYIRETHSLKLTVLNAGFSYGREIEFEVDAVVLNDGNRSEVLLASRLEIECPTSSIPFKSNPPITLKGGEAQAIQFREFTSHTHVRGEIGLREKSQKNIGKVLLVVNTVSKKGTPIVRRIPLFDMVYLDDSQPDVVKGSRKIGGFIQLIDGKSEDEEQHDKKDPVVPPF